MGSVVAEREANVGRHLTMAMKDDKELGPIPAHIREALESTDNVDDYSSHARWVFVKNRGPIHPRSGWTDSACRKVRFGSRTRCGTRTYENLNYGEGSLAV